MDWREDEMKMEESDAEEEGVEEPLCKAEQEGMEETLGNAEEEGIQESLGDAEEESVKATLDEAEEDSVDAMSGNAEEEEGAEEMSGDAEEQGSDPIDWRGMGEVPAGNAEQELKMPKDVFDRLYGYQRQAVTWMCGLYEKKCGGLLADEMGLGKTVQAAAFLTSLKHSNAGSCFLIVVPLTLLGQWEKELQEWGRSTGLAVHVFNGASREGKPTERTSALRGLAQKGGAMLVSYDMLRTSVHQLKAASLGSTSAASLLPKKRKRKTVRAARDDDSPSEDETAVPQLTPESNEERAWDVVIIDEGHRAKDPSCVIGKAMRKLVARSRFILTGTPLQNKLSDLWALMDLVQPGLLGNHATFERNFSEQIAKGSRKDANRYAVELKDHLAKELKSITAPHFLRRLKAEVTGSSETKPEGAHGGSASSSTPPVEELPPKTDVVLWLSLTQAQLELYNLFLGSEVVRKACGQNKCGMEVLRAIAVLKKLSNHPLLCLPQEEFVAWRNKMVQPENSTARQAAPATLDESSLPEMDIDGSQPAADCSDVLARLRALQPGSVEGAALLSCKLRVLSVLLPQLQKRGHRCLIFSHSTRMLDLIQGCVLRALGLKFLRIDGSLEAKHRDLKLQKFQKPDSQYFCICLSTQVGGVGLTITAADRVILVDPAWNPAMDSQAIDRVHRLGQKKAVVVYRLLSSGAIEDKMFRLQVYKRGLEKTALEQEQQIRYFTKKDLKALFEPPNESTSTQSLMAEKIGTDAQEFPDLMQVVVGDLGGAEDPQSHAFWQSSDVLGFSDIQRLFMFLEQLEPAGGEEGEQIVLKAKNLAESLQNEEYMKDQVVAGTWKGSWRGDVQKENNPPRDDVEQTAPLVPLQDC